MIEAVKDTDEFKTLAKDTDFWVKVATNQADSDIIPLGKYIKNSPKSYERIAEAHNYGCFSMSDITWNALAKELDNDMWTINEKYLELQLNAGKKFMFSVDPTDANNLLKADGTLSDFGKEIDYLTKHGIDINTVKYNSELELWVLE